MFYALSIYAVSRIEKRAVIITTTKLQYFLIEVQFSKADVSREK